jgi:hypothetical protein
MTRIIAVAISLLAFGLQPTKATEAPWCAVKPAGMGDMQWDCQYRSVEECTPHVLAGDRGWCSPNPYIVAGPAESGRSVKRRVRQQ